MGRAWERGYYICIINFRTFSVYEKFLQQKIKRITVPWWNECLAIMLWCIHCQVWLITAKGNIQWQSGCVPWTSAVCWLLRLIPQSSDYIVGKLAWVWIQHRGHSNAIIQAMNIGCLICNTCLLPSAARLGNRDVAPIAVLQSRPRERQMYVTVLVPRTPRKFGTRDFHRKQC